MFLLSVILFSIVMCILGASSQSSEDIQKISGPLMIGLVLIFYYSIFEVVTPGVFDLSYVFGLLPFINVTIAPSL